MTPLSADELRQLVAELERLGQSEGRLYTSERKAYLLDKYAPRLIEALRQERLRSEYYLALYESLRCRPGAKARAVRYRDKLRARGVEP